MGKRCCVKTCENSKKEKGVTLFKVPKDSELFSKWSFVCACEKLLLKTNSFICEKHFRSEDIIDNIKINDKTGKPIFEVINFNLLF